MSDTIAAGALACLQYVCCADYDSFQELEIVRGKVLLAMAIFMGKTRLIDNFVIR